MPEPRGRTWSAHVLSWLIPPLVVLGLACHWVGSTASDSGRFADRMTRMLDSQPVRASVAGEITDILIRNGSSSAANLRPAYQLAIESLVRTDTFRTLFHDALFQAHRGLFVGSGSSSSLDLSATIGLLAANLQIRASETTSAADVQESAMRGAFPQWMEGLANTGVVEVADRIDMIGFALLLLALAVGAGVVLLHPQRRQGLVRVGAVLVVAGVAAGLALVAGAAIVVNRITTDPDLEAALIDGFRHVATELSVQARWLVGIGVVLVLAAHTAGAERAIPTWARVRPRLDPVVRLLGTGNGRRLVLATLFVSGGIWGATHVATVITMAGSLMMLLVVFAGLCQLAAVWPRLEPQEHRTKTLAWAGAKLATGMIVLFAVISVTVDVTWSVAAERSLRIDTPEGACNGTVVNCSLPLDQVVFPGSHNAMSSSLSGEWLFPEHNPSILNQLRSGIRALLIDTHLGFPTTVRIPGFRGTLVSTDRAGAQTVPGAEPLDPAADARARELAAQIAGSTTATSQMYLCHNYCELGSTLFSDALRDIARFLDANPGEVVMLLIQDAVNPTRAVAEFEAAGLTDRVATLTLGQPLPTLGELVDAGHQLIVFNETSGTGGPAWYHHMYEGWFGETQFGVRNIDDFNCDPNRGSTDAPFFLLNHWITFSPPDQGRAAQVNNDEFLTARLQQCAAERGRVPNVVAVDFEDRGDLFTVLARESDELRRLAAG